MKRRAPRSQRGAALLTAMLTVALVATFAASAVWQQWRSIEVETAERARVQSSWVLTGALDWARLLLREDGRGGADHLGEPWAVPLQEARLSSFLAADANNTADVGPEMLEAFLSGQIIDMNSMLNVSRLVQNGRRSEQDYLSFARLFELLGLPPAELDRLAENLRFASDTNAGNLSGSAAPLAPQSVEQLMWLGISAETAAALQPYVVVLPAAATTAVNLNTASAEVIYAAVPGLSMAEAQHLVAERERAHFKTHADVSNLLSGGAARLPPGQAGVGFSSRFFEVRARLRLDQLVVEERALIQRDGTTTKVLHRERITGGPTALAQAAVKR